MGEEKIEEFGAARAGEDQLSSYLQRERTEMLDSSAEDLHAAARARSYRPSMAICRLRSAPMAASSTS
jgi:hypothetical protein